MLSTGITDKVFKTSLLLVSFHMICVNYDRDLLSDLISLTL